MSVVVAAAANGEPLDDATRSWISEAVAYARFAGPDGGGTELGNGWGLGHCLLATGHGESSIGPITLDGRVWLSADVRLDDHGRLLASLAARGQRPDAGADDAELVLRAYAAWGEQLLDHLAGDFAFALWDSDKRVLLCARDQLGIVPLCYADLGGRVLVASSPELLLLHPGVSDALDETAIAGWLMTSKGMDFEATAFAAIRRVAPAHTLHCARGELRVGRYWRAPEFLPLLRLRRPEDYVAHFRGLLEQAVGDRIAPGPLAAQLTGGMDSTTIVALAQRLRATRGDAGDLRALTAVLGGSSGDREGEWATLVAEALGIEHELIDDSAQVANDPFAPPKLLTPEPTPYQWTDWQYELVRLASQRARTCLSGLGGDVLLGFLPWYWIQWLAGGHLRRLATAVGDQARLFGQRPHPSLRVTARCVMRECQRPAPVVPGWISASLAARIGPAGRPADDSIANLWSADRRSLTRDPIWQTWSTWSDPTYFRLPLRIRQPLMDLRLLDFAAMIPPHPWLVRKRILREATSDLLPGAIRERRKTLLVAAPRAGTSAEQRKAVAELVRSVPGAERFLDVPALARSIEAPREHDPHDMALDRPIGLVHWMAHR